MTSVCCALYLLLFWHELDVRSSSEQQLRSASEIDASILCLPFFYAFFGINQTSGLEVSNICIELGRGIKPREEHWFHLASEVDICMLCMNQALRLETAFFGLHS